MEKIPTTSETFPEETGRKIEIHYAGEVSNVQKGFAYKRISPYLWYGED